MPAAPPFHARWVAATVIGNALEFYDFVTYAFIAAYIGRAFFPASTPLGSLLLSLAMFGVVLVTRPLGGILIGILAAFSDQFLSVRWTNAWIFLVLVLVMLFRPTGLLGKHGGEKA